MSHALTDEQMLTIWERGLGLGATDRSLLAIQVAQPDIDPLEASRWPLGRRDALLLELRAATFGSRMRYRARCPDCLVELEFDVPVAGLRQEAAGCGVFIEVEFAGRRVTARPPTSEDMRAIEGMEEADRAADELWARCVSIDGIEPVSGELRAAVESQLERADPQADLSFALSCAACNCNWIAPCDVADTLWREIAASARDTLVQVDALARRYGWTEQEVLRLGRVRRDLYLGFAE
jgi:hypothetical protein